MIIVKMTLEVMNLKMGTQSIFWRKNTLWVIIIRCVVYNKRNCIKHRKNYKRLHVFESTKSFLQKSKRSFTMLVVFNDSGGLHGLTQPVNKHGSSRQLFPPGPCAGQWRPITRSLRSGSLPINGGRSGHASTASCDSHRWNDRKCSSG